MRTARSQTRSIAARSCEMMTIVVPLRRKGRVIGALNLLSDTAGQFAEGAKGMLQYIGSSIETSYGTKKKTATTKK